MIRLALCNLAGGSERRVRSRAPDMLVDATFHAIADAGSIPAVSTFRCNASLVECVAKFLGEPADPLAIAAAVNLAEDGSSSSSHTGGSRAMTFVLGAAWQPNRGRGVGRVVLGGAADRVDPVVRR